MSKIEVNTVAPQCGTTLTLGESGDTVVLGSGASQSGFGRSGSVNWQTGSIKTATFTAADGEGYFCDTSSTAFTVNLPAGSAGAIVAIADYTITFATNNITVEANGTEKIGGTDGPVLLAVDGQAATFVYVDSTEGWINVQNVEDSEKGKTEFIDATGGTITNTPTCRIHTFTGPGTFEVTCSARCATNNLLSYVIVAGGAAGGSGFRAGGGGAGGYREVKSPVTPYTASPLDGYSTPANRITLPIGSTSSIPVTVGAGGATNPYPCSAVGGSGSDSIFSTITASGGGGGGSNATPYGPAMVNGTPGGSGGGGAANTGVPTAPGGTGNTPPTSPAQGTNGGEGNWGGPPGSGGGGGGATAAGTNGGPPDNGGPGGAGATSSITASPVARGGGGGGGADAPAGSGGTGGTGGGGKGGCGPVAGSSLGVAGTANTGGGGGGSGGSNNTGQAGGSGIVIIRYKIA